MDLSRTFAELKILFQDNPIGAISEQDIRDFMESIFQFGGIRLPAGEFQAGNEQIIGTSFQCLNQFISTLSLSSPDVVPNPQSGTIKIKRPGIYMVNISLSFTGTGNTLFEGNLVRKRGNEPDAQLNICTFLESIRPNNEISNAGGIDPLQVEADDVLEYNIKADGPGKEFQLRSGQFNMFRIG